MKNKLLHKIHYIRIMFCLKIHFIKTSYHIETNQMICKANQLTGFYIKWVCTEWYFWIVYIHGRIMFASLITVLNCIILKNLSRLLWPVTIVINCALSLWCDCDCTGNVLSCNIVHCAKIQVWYEGISFFG